MDATAVQVVHKNNIKLTSIKAIVPDNDHARLSYYLQSVSSCINNILDVNLTNPDNCTSFTQDTKDRILLFCLVLNPTFMAENGIFIRVESLPRDLGNEFVQITEELHLQGVHLQKDGVSVIDAESVKVCQKMFYKEEWVKYYYTLPLARLLDKKESIDIKLTKQAPSKKKANNNLGNQGYGWDYLCLFVLCVMFNFLGPCCFHRFTNKARKTIFYWCTVVLGCICNVILIVLNV